MSRREPPFPSTRDQHGAASLVVVMLLFFLMSLVAAYTSRNLIFEQRTSVNQYRSVQAFEAAEAGLEWALAQLNGGRIDTYCLESGATSANTSFRQRYLSVDTSSGMITPLLQGATGSTTRRAGCVWDGSAWSCHCPANSDPVLTTPAGDSVYPAFWVSFSVTNVSRPGVVQIVANGCVKLDSACLASSTNSSNVEGRALVTAVVALKSALPSPPAAALTVLGAVPGGGALKAYNTEPDRGGVTIQAGGAIDTTTFTLASTPGTPSSASVVQNDSSLSGIAALGGLSAADRVFASAFGAWPNAYKLQPALVRITCPSTGCRQALADKVTMNPDRVIWVDGDLTLESAGSIGSASAPAAIVVTGRLVFAGAFTNADCSDPSSLCVYGLVYTRVGNWAGSGIIQGAAFVESDLAASAAPTLVYSGSIVDTIRLRSGSFVRAPGGWRDFP